LAVSLTVEALAEQLQAELEGVGPAVLTGVKSLDQAGPAELSFLSNRRYLAAARASAAGAILVGPGIELGQRCVLRCPDPYLSFAEAMAIFHPTPPVSCGVDPGAWIAPDAQVDPQARIEAFAWIGPGARIGAGSWIEAGVVIGAGAVVGCDCRLMPNSVVSQGCTLGDRVWLNPGAVVGSEGFGFARGARVPLKIPQAGDVRIEDDVEIGANSCVDRAAMGTTWVRRGAKLDNLVQVGHAADVGPGSCLVAYSGVAGSSTLGAQVTLAAKAAVLGHLTIGDGVQVGAASVVHDDQPAGARVTGVPAIEHRTWLRAATGFSDLPELIKHMRALQARVSALEAAQEDQT
jgi:UDP-3-O-[3-hydroxymyristoyl] glucosamine N-acyltransferase